MKSTDYASSILTVDACTFFAVCRSYKGDTSLHVTKQKVIAVPDIVTQTAEDGDVLLVCCDGIVEQMKNEDAASFITSDLPANGKDPVCVLFLTCCF